MIGSAGRDRANSGAVGAAKDFPGWLYAILRWDGLDDPYQGIPNTWKKLVVWREQSKYREGGHQWLEEHIKPEVEGIDFVLDLYLPIAE
jgi:hypothetical protein